MEQGLSEVLKIMALCPIWTIQLRMEDTYFVTFMTFDVMNLPNAPSPGILS